MQKQLFTLGACVAAFAFLLLGLQAAAPAPPARSICTGWRLVYEHDQNGAPLAGSLANLVTAVQNAADVKVISTDPVNGNTTVFRAKDVGVVFGMGGSPIVGFTHLGVALINGLLPPSIRPLPYHGVTWFDTSGGYAIHRRSLDDSFISESVLSSGYSWWVRR